MKKIVSAFALAFLLFASTGCNLLPTMNKPSKQSSEIVEESSKFKKSSTYDNTASTMYQPPFSSSSEESSSSAYPDTDDNSGLTFQLSNDGTYYIITGLTNSSFYARKNLIIQGEHNGLPVKEIAEQAFARASFGSIVLPDSIEIMGAAAFDEATIKSINIPSSMESLPFNAFAYSSLEKIELNEGLKTLEQQAFIGTSLKRIELPSSLEEIGISCFQNCWYLEKVSINPTLKIINTLAFCRCESLRYIYIPASVNHMRAAFFDCHDITIDIAADNTYFKIKNNCLMSYDETVLVEFFDKSNIAEYRVPSNVKVVGIYCFAGANINTVIFANTLDYIEGGAFNSSNVKKIVYVGTVDGWNEVIRYSGPITDVNEIVINENYDNGN